MKIFYLIILFWAGLAQCRAQEIILLGPRETKMEGTIPYTVIGEYKARFRDFKGKIVLGEKLGRIQSVDLEIKVNSIQSNCPWCDKIARSRRLLNAARYPKIIFRSDHITHDRKGFKVKGVLEMHGIRKIMTFPFHMVIVNDQKTRRKSLHFNGRWSINRKDFHIVWNKYLDHGGMVVGDDFTVNWAIKVSLP